MSRSPGLPASAKMEGVDYRYNDRPPSSRDFDPTSEEFLEIEKRRRKMGHSLRIESQ